MRTVMKGTPKNKEGADPITERGDELVTQYFYHFFLLLMQMNFNTIFIVESNQENPKHFSINSKFLFYKLQ